MIENMKELFFNQLEGTDLSDLKYGEDFTDTFPRLKGNKIRFQKQVAFLMSLKWKGNAPVEAEFLMTPDFRVCGTRRYGTQFYGSYVYDFEFPRIKGDVAVGVDAESKQLAYIANTYFLRPIAKECDLTGHAPYAVETNIHKSASLSTAYCSVKFGVGYDSIVELFRFIGYKMSKSEFPNGTYYKVSNLV